AWGHHYRQAIGSATALGVPWIGLDIIPGVSGGAVSDQEFAQGLAGGRDGHSNARGGGEGRGANPMSDLRFSHARRSQKHGFAIMREEKDEVVRRAAVFDRDTHTGTLMPSFAAVLATRIRGGTPSDEAALRALLPKGRAKGSAPASSAEEGSFWINYVDGPD